MAEFSKECMDVLRLLKIKKNVLIMGPPACGKTKLLNELALAFTFQTGLEEQSKKPTHVPTASIPIPRNVAQQRQSIPATFVPSPSRHDRHVIKTAFNANSKPRDFITGIIPSISNGESVGFSVTRGDLVCANDLACLPNGASLLIIDELNRGPAVQLFGDSIVAIESDKRLSESDEITENSWPLSVINPETDQQQKTYLSNHLYIVSAMNQADVSIEPLDTAFIRRWQPYYLKPSIQKIVDAFGLTKGYREELPESPQEPIDVIRCLACTWEKINNRISIGRGSEFMIGHGVLLSNSDSALSDIESALGWAALCWTSIVAHLDETFSNDPVSISFVLSAHPPLDYYGVENKTFGLEQRQLLRQPDSISEDNIYNIIYGIAISGEHR